MAEKIVVVQKHPHRLRNQVLFGLALFGVLGLETAMASSGGPFGKISNFIQSNFMPFIGSVGIAGGIGYGAVHAFKHDYGKSAVGIGTAAGGGFMISQYGWFGQQAGISAATLGGHVALMAPFLHLLGA
ncbi:MULTISPECIES: hypothetical protein [Acidithiobacillus]|uniref:Uncharacterized protein n=2 Tax=Acidithiobacillus thiooxidans TaxID=930 RepID=A0A1C2J1U1_ACITH|nr:MULTISPECIES: hypothetical protein [Acidithiobacillus]OCX68129.1 hypothetical protein A6M23_18980 [Acidithiobacillus thiooxidans]OCX82179.1 hypothetical protein A6P08_12590 [Acidithiobacillus thiooxidans]QFX96652.1 hypothetical protein GCD22_02459 [Acidithiobacillus thiooxidans ATCC 19377]